MNKPLVFLAILGVLLAFLVGKWLFGPRTVTLDFENAPLGQVIRSLERQGKIKVQTNLDPETPVTIQVRRTPVFDAVDLLAVRADASWRLVYLFAPDRMSAAYGMAALRESRRTPEGWVSNYFPVWNGVDPASDPRRFPWKVEPVEARTLSAFLDQGSQKTIAQFLRPEDWDPSLTRTPGSGAVERVAKQLARATGGRVEQVVYLTGGMPGGGAGGGREGADSARGTEQGQRTSAAAGSTGGEARGAQGRGGAEGGQWAMRRGGREGNQQWLEEREEHILSSLPREDADALREIRTELRELREAIADLDPEARRAAMMEYFNRPDVQERREEAMSVRDARRTPEQREQRFRQSVNRKLEARAEQGRPLVAKPQ